MRKIEAFSTYTTFLFNLVIIYYKAFKAAAMQAKTAQ